MNWNFFRFYGEEYSCLSPSRGREKKNCTLFPVSHFRLVQSILCTNLCLLRNRFPTEKFNNEYLNIYQHNMLFSRQMNLTSLYTEIKNCLSNKKSALLTAGCILLNFLEHKNNSNKWCQIIWKLQKCCECLRTN